MGTLVSSTNKTGSHNITEILLKVVLNTITLTLSLSDPKLLLKIASTGLLISREDYNGMEKANTKQTIILLQLEWMDVSYQYA